MIINENLIEININAKNKNEVIKLLSELSVKAGKVSDVNTFIKDVHAREKSYSTGIGDGIAIPHAKSSTVKEAMIVFGKLQSSVEWGSIDKEDVDLVFLLGVPSENKDNLHLKILSDLSRKLMDKEFIKSLRKAKNKTEVIAIINSVFD